MTRRTRKARAANGQGSVYQQKDGLWAAAVTVNGKRSISRAKTRDEAERLRLALLRKREEGSLIVGPDPTLGVYLDRWLEARREAIKPWTYRGYRTQITHIKAVLGKVKLRALTSEHVVVLVRRRMEEGASPKHVRLAHQCLRTALGDALRERRVSVNVASRELLARGVLPIVRRQPIDPYTEREARQLVEAAKGDRMEALWVLALKSGLRQGELLGLTWDDVDFEHRTVSVNKSLQRKDGRFFFETTKSPKSRRSVRLSAEVVDVLRAHRERQAAVSAQWNLVFTTRQGRPLSARNVVRAFKRFLARKGLREIRFHDLRHTHATLLLVAGVPTKVVQERLGHSSVNLTSDVYQHLLNSLQQDAAERLEGILGEPVATPVATLARNGLHKADSAGVSPEFGGVAPEHGLEP